MIKSAKEYFDSDFNRILSSRQTQKLKCAATGDEVEVIARVELDFDANTKFISYYIPQTSSLFDVCKALLSNSEAALSISESCYIEQEFCGERIASSELRFSGRIFIYSEGELTGEQKEVLRMGAKEVGLAVQFRGPQYATERSTGGTTLLSSDEGQAQKSKADKSGRSKTANKSITDRLVKSLAEVLIQSLQKEWESVEFEFPEDSRSFECKACYYAKDDKTGELAEVPLNVDEQLGTVVNNVRNSCEFPVPPTKIRVFRNGKYEIKFHRSDVKVKPMGLSEIKEEVSKLKGMNLRHARIEDLRETIGRISAGYLQICPIVGPETALYRGVPWKEKPQNVSQLTHPPIEWVTKLHRAGKPYKPLFYCSTHVGAILYEKGANTGDKFAISTWTPTERLMLNNVGYHADAFEKLGSNRVCPDWQAKAELDEDSTQRNVLLRKFFSEEFTKNVPKGEEYLYKISVAIAEHHFQQEMFDGLLYPSIAFRAHADNVALKPTSVEKKLRLKIVKYISVDDFNKTQGYKITLLDFADSFTKDGSIEWKGRGPVWKLKKKGDTLVLRAENKGWVAQDSKGEIVEPE